ncbi:DUF3375 family protein [Saccharomonospora sp.]|uniref:DUF3375 family protein n=1 Tax=Saccharomonospora sp. TaxID=33913 RepID=UPI002626F3B9|nr:DUF3375 family protein [Saccharomonospora sp.]
MGGKTAEQLFHEFTTNAAADVTLSLLRSKDALLNLALMAAHLGDGQIVDGQTLTAVIDADLPRLLRSAPSTEDELTPLATDADTLLTRWTKRGWVHRSVDPATRVERYQLTSGAAQAVRQMRNLRRHTSVATESALSMVMAEMHQIAAEANPDPTARRAALDEQIAILTEQRRAIEGGQEHAVDHRELVDRVSALAHLIERIPSDIARYGERMQANTTALVRQSLADDPEEFAESLQRMFDGHDVIAESPEGLAFRAFATLIATPSQRSQLESDIAEVLAHLDDLPDEVTEALSGFIGTTWERVQEVEETRAVAFRRVSSFVRGGDASYYRSMRTRVAEAQAAATEAFRHSHGGRDIGFTIPISGVSTTSVGRLRLHDGTSDTPDPLDDTADFPIDPAAVVGQESLDWVALHSTVNTAVDAHGGTATLPDVLARLPEPRTGDIIALWSLATRFGETDTAQPVTVSANTSAGIREITLPQLLFTRRLPDLAAPTAGAVTFLQSQTALLEDTLDA